jgi:hypothetical protein
MIIYRVASGRGWTSKTVRQGSQDMATIRFTSNRSGGESAMKFTTSFSSIHPENSGEFELNSLENERMKAEQKFIVEEV